MDHNKQQFEIVDELPEKPKRKKKAAWRLLGTPWRWMLAAFIAGAGVAALLVLLFIPASVEQPAPAPLQQIFTSSPPAPQSTAAFTQAAAGEQIEDAAWRGDLFAVTTRTRAGLYHRDLDWIGDMNAYPFENLPRDSFNDLAIRPDQTQAAAISTNYWFENGTLMPTAYIKIWTLEENGGRLVQEFMAHSGTNGGFEGPYLGAALAFSPDNRLLASGAGRGEVVLWNAQAGYQPIGSPLFTAATGTVALAFSDDNQRLTALIRRDSGETRTNCLDCGEIQVWDVHDPYHPLVIHKLFLQHQAALTAALSPNGHYAAYVDLHDPEHCCAARAISVWDVQAKQLVISIPLPSASAIKEIAFSEDSDMLAFVWHTPGNSFSWSAEIVVTGLQADPYGVWSFRELARRALDGLEVSHLHIDASGKWVQYMLNNTTVVERWYLQPNITQNMNL